jgi:hypothetical protein
MLRRLSGGSMAQLIDPVRSFLPARRPAGFLMAAIFGHK